MNHKNLGRKKKMRTLACSTGRYWMMTKNKGCTKIATKNRRENTVGTHLRDNRNIPLHPVDRLFRE